MSEKPHGPAPEPTLNMLLDQVNELTIEVTILRESIVTAAEWDNQARRERQQALDATIAAARQWMRILIAVNALLVLAMIWLLVRVGF